MALITMNLCTNAIDTLMIGYFLSKLLDKEFTDKNKAILSLSALIVFSTLINLTFSLVSILGFVIIFTISMAVYSYLLDMGFLKILIYGSLGTILMFIVEMIVANTILIIFNIEPLMIVELSIYRIMAIIISTIVFYLIVKYGQVKVPVPKYDKLNDPIYIILIGSFNLVIIFMTFTLYKYMEAKSLKGYIYLSAMGLGSIIFSWTIYRITQKMIYQSRQESIWKMREEEFRKKDFYVQSIDDILHTIKSQGHDLNNYLSTLYGLIFLERYEEAKKYITEVNKRMGNMNNIIETNHPVITVLVTTKKDRAIEENIQLLWDIDFPSNLPFDFVDLSIIIGNLLDNAIEACQLVKDDIKRKIELSIYIQGKQLIIEVTNTKNESIIVNTRNIVDRFTTKSDHENHGYGLANIEYIVKEYNGIMDMKDLGNSFSTHIELSIEEADWEIRLETYAV